MRVYRYINTNELLGQPYIYIGPTLIHKLSHPPSFTTVRVNMHLASVQHVKNLLFDELQKQFNGLSFAVLQHLDLQDVLVIPVIGPRSSLGFPGGAVVKNPPANAGDTGLSPGLGRSHMPQSN